MTTLSITGACGFMLPGFVGYGAVPSVDVRMRIAPWNDVAQSMINSDLPVFPGWRPSAAEP